MPSPDTSPEVVQPYSNICDNLAFVEMKLHGSIEVFLDVAAATRALLLVLITIGTVSSTAALKPEIGLNACPGETTCVRPLRCTAAMELYWSNLTLAMESGSVATELNSPLEDAFQRCWIVTDRAKHEGICCQMDRVPREYWRPSKDNDETTVNDGFGFLTGEEEEEQELESKSNDINHGKGNRRKRTISDYGQLIGSDFPSSNPSHSRTKRCIIGPKCLVTHHRYRRFDGKCNNIEPGRSLWGSSGYPMERVLPPVYGNGVSSSRTLSRDGRFLPSARVVSDVMFTDLNVPHPKHNVLMMQLGQFLVHDISRNKAGAEDAKCCLPDNTQRVPHPTPGCSPIRVSSKDSFYSQFNVKCMHFVRTAMAPPNRCQVGHGRQLSEVTHFIDGSGIYGSSKKGADELRAHQGGRLKSIEHRHVHNELLPLEEMEGACSKHAKACFKAGDNRVNQVITLVAFHTLFLREHNRIARSLQKMNPHWDDNVLFHEARRIVGAEWQHIIYNEYLPKVVGPDYMEMYDLHTSRGYSKFYNPEKNPAMTSEFSSAAFRFGHSTVPGEFAFPKGQVKTHDTFFDPSSLSEPKFFDELFHGIMTQPMQEVDDKFTHSMTWFLNPEDGNPFGRDIAATNIKRGLDHAVRPYNSYQQLGGREVKRNFADYGPMHEGKLRRLYAHPDDVDLYVGGMLEHPVRGGVVGPTFAEIISDQFSRLKQGDRYFYSNGPEANPGHFTKPQLQEVHKMTLAGVLCANANDRKSFSVAPEALNLPHATKNPHVSCLSKQIPRLNLNWWKD